MFKKIIILIFILTVSSSLWAEDISRIIAKVNDIIITSKDLDEFTEIISYRKFQEDGQDYAQYDKEQLKREALDKFIEDKIILCQAKREDLQINPIYVDSKLREIIASCKSMEEFEKSLIQKGLTMTRLKEKIKEQFLVKEVIDKYVRSHVNVFPQEVRQYYEANKKEFIEPTRYMLWVVRSSDTTFLEDIKNKIKDRGIDVVKGEYADAFVRVESPLKELAPEIANVLKDMAANSSVITLINEKPHLLYIEDIKSGQEMTFQQARDRIQNYLFKNKFNERFKIWLDKLKADAVVKIYPPYDMRG